MKRFIVLLVVLTLCASLLVVPALAAETSYSFTFSALEHDTYFSGHIPDGKYILQIWEEDVPLLPSDYFVDFVWDSFDEFGGSFSYYFDDHYALRFEHCDGEIYIYFYTDGDLNNHVCFELDTTVILTPYVPPASGSADISGIVSSDVLPDVLSRLFQLITDNPLLSSFCAASLILVCIPLFSDLKKASR
ncbi:MAG: hypothetical protein IJN67_13340 [Oscillospiraceae bacterium]|nr:hypothetical protein [Oscillospiraceae bacterium]